MIIFSDIKQLMKKSPSNNTALGKADKNYFNLSCCGKKLTIKKADDVSINSSSTSLYLKPAVLNIIPSISSVNIPIKIYIKI